MTPEQKAPTPSCDICYKYADEYFGKDKAPTEAIEYAHFVHGKLEKKIEQLSADNPDWSKLAQINPPEENTKDNKAWRGAWLEGEMVGYAKAMVKVKQLESDLAAARKEIEELKKENDERDQLALEFADYLENERWKYDYKEQKMHTITEHWEYFKQVTKQ